MLPSAKQPCGDGKAAARSQSEGLSEDEAKKALQIIALCHCRTEVLSSQRPHELDWVFSCSQTVVISHSSLVPSAQLLRDLYWTKSNLECLSLKAQRAYMGEEDTGSSPCFPSIKCEGGRKKEGTFTPSVISKVLSESKRKASTS